MAKQNRSKHFGTQNRSGSQNLTFFLEKYWGCCKEFTIANFSYVGPLTREDGEYCRPKSDGLVFFREFAKGQLLLFY